jgi:hypothetical protein
MMVIKNLAKNGPVGVLKPRCITDDDRIRALTTAPRIKPTSIFLRSARRPNPRQSLHLSTRNFCSDNRDQFRKLVTDRLA